jgi:hypothetical protein
MACRSSSTDLIGRLLAATSAPANDSTRRHSVRSAYSGEAIASVPCHSGIPPWIRTVSCFWRTYCQPSGSRLFGVVILDSASRIGARMRASVKVIHGGADFAEGQERGANWTRSTAPSAIWRRHLATAVSTRARSIRARQVPASPRTPRQNARSRMMEWLRDRVESALFPRTAGGIPSAP